MSHTKSNTSNRVGEYKQRKIYKVGFNAVVIYPNGKFSSILLNNKKECFAPFFCNYDYVVEHREDIEFGENAGKYLKVAYSPDNKMKVNKDGSTLIGSIVRGPVVVWSEETKLTVQDITSCLAYLTMSID